MCLNAVRKSGIYLGIVGTRYGSIAKDGESFTQLEYEEAILHNKKTLIYIIDEETHPVLLKYVDTGDDALRLAKFKSLLLSRHVCKSFSSPDDLTGQVSIDLINLFQDIGENVRAAIERGDLTQLLVEAGFLFSNSAVTLDVSQSLDDKGEGVFRFSDKELETVMAAAFLAQNIKNNNFSILEGGFLDSV